MLVRFALDSTLPTSQQFAQVSQAIADGQLTVDEAKQVVEIIKLQAEARVAEGGGADGERKIALFKEMAHALAVRERGELPPNPPTQPAEHDAPSNTCPPAD